jgi:UDP-glucose 4-epimerase
MNDMKSLAGKRVLITGGLGFLGSSLCHRLVRCGCRVTIVDNLAPLYGGNRFNVREIERDIRIVLGDIRDEQILAPLVADADLIFHLAAQVSYIDSLSMPKEDLELNAGTTLELLELCRKTNRDAIILFASSRMVAGRIEGTTMAEDITPKPLSLYGIHKLASEHYLRTYHDNFGIRSIIFRITNPYGPRQQIKHDKYSLVGWFVRRAMEGNTIRVFGEGLQIRDYIYVDDIVAAFTRCAVSHNALGQVVNVGSGVGTKFRDMVSKVIEIVGSGQVEHVPWPQGYEKLETGDVVADISRLQALTGWTPNVSIEDGIRGTVDYYREHGSHYVEPLL